MTEPSAERRNLSLGWALVVLFLALFAGTFGVGYAVAALALGGTFLLLTLRLRASPSRPRASLLFHYSLLYLALLFVVMAVDVL